MPGSNRFAWAFAVDVNTSDFVTVAHWRREAELDPSGSHGAHNRSEGRDFDEPTTALDVTAQVEVCAPIRVAPYPSGEGRLAEVGR